MEVNIPNQKHHITLMRFKLSTAIQTISWLHQLKTKFYILFLFYSIVFCLVVMQPWINNFSFFLSNSLRVRLSIHKDQTKQKKDRERNCGDDEPNGPASLKILQLIAWCGSTQNIIGIQQLSN